MGSWPSQPQDSVSFGVWLCSRSWFLELPDSSQRKAMGSNKLFPSLHGPPESLDTQGGPVQTGNVSVLLFIAVFSTGAADKPSNAVRGTRLLRGPVVASCFCPGRTEVTNYPLF